jgi:hypothetical protein
VCAYWYLVDVENSRISAREFWQVLQSHLRTKRDVAVVLPLLQIHCRLLCVDDITVMAVLWTAMFVDSELHDFGTNFVWRQKLQWRAETKLNACLPNCEETLNFILAIPNTGVCQRRFRGIRTQGQTTACETVEVQKWNHILPSDAYCCWLVYAMYYVFAFLIRFCGCCKVMTSRETIVLL